MPDPAPRRPPPPGRHRAPDGGPLPAPVPPAAWPGDDAWRQAVAVNITRLEAMVGTATGRRTRLPGPPADTAQWRRAVVLTLASLNELIIEMTAATSPGTEWAEMVYLVFRDCTWALGLPFREQRAPAGWTPPWDRPEGAS
jgi:hypothetical protein